MVQKHAEEDKQRHKEALELDSYLKQTALNTSIEKLKAEHALEIQGMKQQTEIGIKEIDHIHQQEKKGLEDNIANLKNEIEQLKKEKFENSTVIPPNNCLEEIRELNSHLDAFKKQAQEEINLIKKQRDEALKSVDSLQSELTGLKHTMRNTQTIQEQSAKNYKQKLEKAKELIETNENAQIELKKSKKKISELNNYVTKLESNCKRLKMLLSKKDREIEDERENNKQKLNSERKKVLQAHEGFARAQEEYSQSKAIVLHEIDTKNKLISRLSRRLRDTQRDDSDSEDMDDLKENKKFIKNSNNLPRSYTVHTEGDLIFSEKRKSCIAGFQNSSKIGITLLQQLKKY